MTQDQIRQLSDSLGSYVKTAWPCLPTRRSRKHLQAYARGLISDLPRKSVEPMALEAGMAVRTLQAFLANYTWDHAGLRDIIRQRIVGDHLPAPGEKKVDDLGVIGLIDETSVAKKGDKTPGVQRQHCGSTGKIDNCIVTVHLAVRHGSFLAMLDSDLFLPERTWHQDRPRCQQAGIPDAVAYRPKWRIALEQIQAAIGGGVRFDWLTFDEGYGNKPQFLRELESLGQLYVCEVPKNTRCWTTYPRYKSPSKNYVAKTLENVGRHSPVFTGKSWKRVKLVRQTLGPQAWEVKSAQVWLADGDADRPRLRRPTGRTYWLIVARSGATGELKYFLSNAPAKTKLMTLLKVAFSRWGVEHVFRLAKTEIGFDHYEGRTYQGLIRHLLLCQWMFLFVAERTNRYRGEKWGVDDGTDGPGAQRDRPLLAHPTPRELDPTHRLGDRLSPTTQPRRQTIPTTHDKTTGVAL